jgi:hypothetical protein
MEKINTVNPNAVNRGYNTGSNVFAKCIRGTTKQTAITKK